MLFNDSPASNPHIEEERKRKRGRGREEEEERKRKRGRGRGAEAGSMILNDSRAPAI